MAGWLSGPSEHERVEALLSPYLDGRVTPAERALVERHLPACSECSHSLATLRATVTAVREMPRVRAPRSFTLSRSMAQQPQTNPWLAPVLRAATAVATLLLVITVAGDLFMRGTSVPTAAPVAFVPLAQESGARSPVSATSQAEARELSAAPEPPVEDLMGRGGMGGGAGPGLEGGGAVPPSGVGAAVPLASPAPTQPAAAPTSVQETPTTKNADAASSVPTLTTGAQPMPAPSAAPLAASAPTTSTPAAKSSALQVPTASPMSAAPAQPPVPPQLAAPKRSATEPTPTTGAQSERAPVAPPVIAPAPPTEAAYVAPAPVTPAPSADQAQTESPAVSQTIAWRIAEGLLAVLAIVFGVAAWIVHRRS
jgi:hypothetical protein